MADITMCTNTLCPNACDCYRIQAKPGEWQSYSEFKYEVSAKGVICKGYWPILKTTTSGNTR